MQEPHRAITLHVQTCMHALHDRSLKYVCMHRQGGGDDRRSRRSGVLLLLHEGQPVPVRHARPSRDGGRVLEVDGEGQGRVLQQGRPARRDEEDARVLRRQGAQRGEDQLGDARVHAGAEKSLLQLPERSSGTYKCTATQSFCLYFVHELVRWSFVLLDEAFELTDDSGLTSSPMPP